MKKILVLGRHSLIAQEVKSALSRFPGVEVVMGRNRDPRQAAGYRRDLPGVNVIASFLGPMDVDLDFEALFDAIDVVQPPLQQFLMMSAAGVDHEVQGHLDRPGIKDWPEYVNEQRYAVKMADEAGVPDTILRPVKIVHSRAVTPPRIIEEGRPVPAAQVSDQNVVKVVLDVIMKRKYQNQSIAILDKSGDSR